MRGFVLRAGLIVAAVVLGACGGGGTTSSSGTITIAKAPVLSGDAQIGQVGAVLPSDLQVLVTEDGAPKPGESITFTPTGGSVNPTVVVSDLNGIAKTTWTLGTVAGTPTVAGSLRAAIGSPLIFTATANPGPVKHLTRGSGDGQVAAINTNFAQSLNAALTDSFGNARVGVIVTWVVQTGSAILSEPGAATDSSGISSQIITAGASAGPLVIRATTASLPAASVDFNLSVASAIKVVSANGAGAGVNFTSVSNTSTNPAIDTIPVGAAIRWVQGSGTHSVQSVGATFTGSGTLNPTGYTLIFNTPGTYHYDCGFHGASMTGTVVVQ
jgi:adhesin/invasin